MGVFSKGNNMISETNITVISQNTELKGDIVTEGIIQIEGKIDGKVVSKDSVIIGTDGIVTGEIYSEEAVINGSLLGKVEAAKVKIGERGKVNGTIISEVFAIAEGGDFEGDKKMRIKKAESSYSDVSSELS